MRELIPVEIKCDGCQEERKKLDKTWWGEMLCEECIRTMWLQQEMREMED